MNSINQPGWSTSGDQSPMAGRDQYITYGRTEDSRTTDVKLDRQRESWVTSRRVAVLSVISSLVTVGTFAWTAYRSTAAWSATSQTSAVDGVAARVAELVASLWLPVAASLVLLVITIDAWQYWNARRKKWPAFPRRRSMRRALVPGPAGSNKFYRATARAECAECRGNNRPEVFGKLYRAPDDTGGRLTYRCSNKHVTKFRGHSLFAD